MPAPLDDPAVRRTLERMRAVDRAWNARRWNDYADLLDDDLVAYMAGEPAPHGKAEHVERAREFCEAFPDSVVHFEPYLDLFATHDGGKSCSVARLTGTASCEVRMPRGATMPVSHGCFDVTFVAVCTWRGGRIVEQREYVDQQLMQQQLRESALTPDSKEGADHGQHRIE